MTKSVNFLFIFIILIGAEKIEGMSRVINTPIFLLAVNENYFANKFLGNKIINLHVMESFPAKYAVTFQAAVNPKQINSKSHVTCLVTQEIYEAELTLFNLIHTVSSQNYSAYLENKALGNKITGFCLAESSPPQYTISFKTIEGHESDCTVSEEIFYAEQRLFQISCKNNQ